MCTSRCTQTYAHSQLRYRFSGTGLFPFVSSKGEQKQGKQPQCHTALLCSNLKDNQHWQQSPIFPQVLSGLSTHLQALAGHKAGATPVLALLWWQCHRSQRRRIGAFRARDTVRGFLKGCSRQHQDFDTVLLSYQHCNPAPDLGLFPYLVFSPQVNLLSNFKKQRKRLWPIFRPSDLAIKKRKKK